MSGVLITNVSDHLPAFTVYKHDQCNTKEIISEKWTRNRSKEALAALKEDPKKLNWDGVYVHDVNIACDSIMTLLIDLYEKHCTQSIAKKNGIAKPWMTKGLQNAGKEKKHLYRYFF